MGVGMAMVLAIQGSERAGKGHTELALIQEGQELASLPGLSLHLATKL